MRDFTLFCALIFSQCVFSQTNDEYVGGGNYQGLTVSYSSQYQNEEGKVAAAKNTLTANGLIAPKMEASRFLHQATFGPNEQEINALVATGLDFDQWLEEQFALPHPSYVEAIEATYDEIALYRISAGFNVPDAPQHHMFVSAWWDRLMKNDDQLRQRVTMALGELCVISFNSGLRSRPLSMSNYYDVLAEESFGNYGALLQRITRNLAMGVYLSHFNNPKSNPDQNTSPDENYAREILQLFSIGLYQLNNDGTPVVDVDGNFIPTYDNEDIAGLAKVLTGLGLGARVDGNNPNFGQGYSNGDFSVPMVMYADEHEPGPKAFLDFETDGSLDPLEEVEAAIEHIFNHPNVGPFVSIRLIQQLVKSNPSPQYVNRVADVFNNNGEGVRGDMKSVIRAILLDEEARSCDAIQNPYQGKLKESMTRYFHVVRSLDTDSPGGFYFNRMSRFGINVGQVISYSPSVFNFYSPFYAPPGEIAQSGLRAPEFQLHNSRTAISFLNEVQRWLNNSLIWNLNQDMEQGVSVAWGELEEKAKRPEELINYLDAVYTNGNMTRTTQHTIRQAIVEIDDSGYGSDWLTQRAKVAVYLTLVSPDYAILK